MKAIIYQPDNDIFCACDMATPQLESPYDVLIEVDAVGLNPVDAKVNYWFGIVADGTREFVGGLDVSGTIVAKGKEVYQWQLGDRVLYHGNMRRRQGGFAQLAIQDSRTLTPHPEVNACEAAASPCAGWTAYRAINDKLHMASHKQSVAIYGASGGVGSYAVQLCRYFNVPQVIAICSERNFDYVRSLGATHCFDYRDEKLLEKLAMAVGSDGVDCALDCFGQKGQRVLSASLGFDGQLVELVNTIDSAQHERAFERGLTLHQLSLGSGHVYGNRGFRSIVNAGMTMNLLMEQQKIQAPKLTVIELADIPDALTEIRLGHTCGKYVAAIK